MTEASDNSKNGTKLGNAKHIAVVNGIGLKKVHAKRLRDLYRSAGWPYLDVVEVELLAAGLLERLQEDGGHERMRVSDAGIQFLSQAVNFNRQVKDPHEALVEKVAHDMLKDGRLVWTNLSLRAKVTLLEEEQGTWRYCMPDVFSIRNSSVQAYLEPVVHEIKVNRADLLGDLKRQEKRAAYLELGGQCWYVLGRDAKDRPIADPDEIPTECGVIQLVQERREILRMAPKRQFNHLPFDVWMSLAKATPLSRSDTEPYQVMHQVLSE
jgi:hypothetical protein